MSDITRQQKLADWLLRDKTESFVGNRRYSSTPYIEFSGPPAIILELAKIFPEAELFEEKYRGPIAGPVALVWKDQAALDLAKEALPIIRQIKTKKAHWRQGDLAELLAMGVKA